MQQRGFTIIELIITLVIVSIVTMMAMPSMQAFIKNNRIKTETGELTTAMAFARSEAIKTGRSLTLCARENDTTCGSDWKKGWLLFVDATSATDATPDRSYDGGTVDRMVKTRGDLPDQMVLTTAGLTDPSVLGFSPSGGATETATFTLCDDRSGNTGREITVRLTGRPSSKSGVSCP